MNALRTLIATALDALIEEKNGFAFQRLAYQCLQSRWPSLISVAEQSDHGEDAITILGECSDGIVRSLACSLTAAWTKVSSDADKIEENRCDVQEFIFATPKTVTREITEKWARQIHLKYGWKLIVVEKAEFVAILERPEAQWIREQHLNICRSAIPDVDLIKFYAQCLDRPAFQVSFEHEVCMDAFDKAIEDTIAAINTGRSQLRNGQLVCQMKGKLYLQNAKWVKRLSDIVGVLTQIQSKFAAALGQRQIYVSHAQDGRQFYHIADKGFNDWMDDKRAEIGEIFGEICREADITAPTFVARRTHNAASTPETMPTRQKQGPKVDLGAVDASSPSHLLRLDIHPERSLLLEDVLCPAFEIATNNFESHRVSLEKGQYSHLASVPPLKIDRKAIQKAFVILLRNALKHAKHGPSKFRLEVDAVIDGMSIHIRFRDWGIGFVDYARGAFRDLPRHTPREDCSRKSQSEDDLYIVHQIVNAHGGTMHLSSACNPTEITISLPVIYSSPSSQ